MKSSSKATTSWLGAVMNAEKVASFTGVERISSKESHIVRRLIWLILLAGGIAFMVYHVTMRIREYSETPTYTKLTVTYAKIMPPLRLDICWSQNTEGDYRINTTYLSSHCHYGLFYDRCPEIGEAVMYRTYCKCHRFTNLTSGTTGGVGVSVETNGTNSFMHISSNTEENAPIAMSNMVFMPPNSGLIDISVTVTNITFVKDCTSRELPSGGQFDGKMCRAECKLKSYQQHFGCNEWKMPMGELATSHLGYLEIYQPRVNSHFCLCRSAS